MKFINVLIWVLIIALACDSCGGNKDPFPVPDVTEPPSNSQLEEIKINLAPAQEDLHSVAIQFLIDNSRSIEDECGGLGASRYDFVNFLLDVFRTIPEITLPNLYVGVSSFGNEMGEYVSLVGIQQFSRVFQPVTKPSDTELGGSQSFNKAIQESITSLSSAPVEKRYLILVTDGQLYQESKEQIESVLTQTENDKNFFIYASLFCPDHSGVWNSIDGVNDVFNKLDMSAVKLLDDLDSFLPPNSLLISAENWRDSVGVPEYYSSSSFLFWNAYDQKKIKIGDNYITDFLTVEAGVEKNTNSIGGCMQRTYTLGPSPSDNWLLFIKHTTFQEFVVSITPFPEGEMEIVHNLPIRLGLEVFSKNGYDLSKWKDCLLVQVAWMFLDNSGGDLLRNPQPCADNDGHYWCLRDLDGNLFSEVTWTPQFQAIEKVNLQIRVNGMTTIKESEFVSWEGATQSFDVKLKPEYDANMSSQVRVVGEDLLEKKFIFNNVTSFDLVNLYLVSEGDLDDGNCPYPINNSGSDLNVYKIKSLPVCDQFDLRNSGGVCATVSSSSHTMLEYTYTVYLRSNVIYLCKYDRLYFDWTSNQNQKETTWECESFQVSQVCEEVDRPYFLP